MGALTAGALMAPTAGANEAAWRIETTPNPAGATLSQFESVSCAKEALCFAVGDSSQGAATSALVEAWDGTAWSLQPVPAPTAPASAGSPTSSALYAVRCVTPRACTAVGGYSSSSAALPLVYHWSGGAWALQSAPSPPHAKTSTLFGVACTSARACTAVGDFGTSHAASLGFAERWNGRIWSLEQVPGPSGSTGSQLVGVDCETASRCIAVGSYHGAGGSLLPLGELWAGGAWAPTTSVTPSGATLAAFNSVRCGGPTTCTAVGFYQAANGATDTLAELWNGKTWAVEPTPNPAGASTSFLEGVKCLSPKSCEAVGYYEKGVANFTLAEAWNGHKWVTQATPNRPGASDSFLYSVTCTSLTACSAVALYQESNKSFTLAERYSG